MNKMQHDLSGGLNGSPYKCRHSADHAIKTQVPASTLRTDCPAHDMLLIDSFTGAGTGVTPCFQNDSAAIFHNLAQDPVRRDAAIGPFMQGYVTRPDCGRPRRHDSENIAVVNERLHARAPGNESYGAISRAKHFAHERCNLGRMDEHFAAVGRACGILDVFRHVSRIIAEESRAVNSLPWRNASVCPPIPCCVQR